jgi:LAS superfamily LD-carboxypeptidase LdcB
MKKIIFTLFILFSSSSFALSLNKSLFKHSKITPETNYEIYSILQKAKRYSNQRNREKALFNYTKALSISSKNRYKERNIDQSDYLETHYQVLQLIKEEDKERKNYIKLSKKLLNFLDKATSKGIWEGSELGQLQIRLYKELGEELALHLINDKSTHKFKKYYEALRYINKSTKFIVGFEDYHLLETKVKVLFKLKRDSDAYQIINDVLSKYPTYYNFQNYLSNKSFINWRKNRK